MGSRLPLMREIHDVDLDYHVRHSALPHPGGQRELGVLVSRLHSNELDLHRPLWEVHLIEGLEGNRFAIYSKMHHSLVDGVSGMRLIMRALSSDPTSAGTPSFWTRRRGRSARRARTTTAADQAARARRWRCSAAARRRPAGCRGPALDLALAAVDDRHLQAPYRAPDSVLGERTHRAAAVRHPAVRVRARQAARPRLRSCTLNDIVLYLSGTRPAPLPGRARAAPRPPAHGRDPGQPARRRGPVDGHLDRRS